MSFIRSLGGKGKKTSVTNLRSDPVSARSTTPTPGHPNGKPTWRSGLLTIRVLWAEGLALPSGTEVPAAVKATLPSQQAKEAASVSPTSVLQKRRSKRGERDSVQRAQCWWLPYLVMEFEVNQVLITPLGGELYKPLYMYQAHL
jgi:serum/glucocorticoid-regulated kinase 2